MKKWILTGLAVILAVVAIATIHFFMTAPANIERGQNRIAVPRHITPAAVALQKTLDVADIMPTACSGSATSWSAPIAAMSTCRG